MRKLILLFACLAMAMGARAEEIIQVVPFHAKAGTTYSAKDRKGFVVNLVNGDAHAKEFQFDILLPDGMKVATNSKGTIYRTSGLSSRFYVYDEEEEEDITYYELGMNKLSNTTQNLYRVLITSSLEAPEDCHVSGNDGEILTIYYTTDADMADGVYPIIVNNVAVYFEGDREAYLKNSSSYVVVGDGNPLETGTDLDLSGMTAYVPSFVTDSLNAALAKNGSLRSLDLGGATEFGAALRVPENVVWRTAVDGGLKRAFDAGKKATVCLPFALPADKAAELGKFYQFGGLKDGTTDVVTMTEVTDGLTANTPYIFEPLADVGGLSFGGDSTCTVTTAGSAGDEFAFLGTYDLKQWGEGDAELGTVYGFAGKDTTLADGTRFEKGQFVKFAAGAYAQPFRAYLKYSGGLADAGMASAKGGAVRLPDVINIEWVKADGTTTGIGSVGGAAEALHQADGWFTIDGRKLAGKPARRGVYIHGGKQRVITD